MPYYLVQNIINQGDRQKEKEIKKMLEMVVIIFFSFSINSFLTYDPVSL